jgi:hypothetical protein
MNVSSSSLDTSISNSSSNSNNLNYSNKESDSSNAFSSSLVQSQIIRKRKQSAQV